MPTVQYGPTLDKRLNKLGRKIETAEAKIAEGTQEKDEAWTEISSVRDEVAKDKPFRFIADNGRVYAFQERQGSQSFDAKKFEALLFQTFPAAEARKIWTSITSRVLDTDKLEAAKRTGKISQDLIDLCMETKPNTFARVHPEWTKDDANTARILGIEKLP